MLAVIVLTYNEERHLERALSSIVGVADEIVVVDSFSSDQTIAIAKKHNAIVLQHPFVNQARQFQWALDNAPIKSTWIMRLDADEYIEPDLKAEIVNIIPSLPSEVTGINLKRKLVFMNRQIKHGGRGILVMLRIWRRGFGRIEDRWMDEHIYVSAGRTITFNGGFADHSLYDLTFFTEKHNKYATREAIEVLNARLNFMAHSEQLSKNSSSHHAAIKRWMKERLYNRVPFQFGAAAYFIYRYLFRLGFLDGREGLIYHVLQGFWYRFLVGAKVSQLQTNIAHLANPEDIKAELQRVTGLDLGHSAEPHRKLRSSTSEKLNSETP